MCQNQLIVSYNFKRQYLQQEPNIKKEFAVTAPVEDGQTNFATVLVAEFGQDAKPVIKSLPELGPPIMPNQEQAEQECTICRMKFNTPRGYQLHLKIVHSEKYVCEYCGFQTIYKPQIRDHLMTHNMGYVCCVCEEKFPNRILRKQHQQLKHIVSNVGGE
jgi:DNA-directed RNA polymerase subunit RPC12/RpoP